MPLDGSYGCVRFLIRECDRRRFAGTVRRELLEAEATGSEAITGK